MTDQLARSNLPPSARPNHRGGTAFDRRRSQNKDRWPDNLWAALRRAGDHPAARFELGTELATAEGRRVIASRAWRSWTTPAHWVYFDNLSRPYRETDIALLLCSPWLTAEREARRVTWLFEVGYTLHFGSVTGRLVSARVWDGSTIYRFHFSDGIGYRDIVEARLLALHLQLQNGPPDGGTSTAGAGNILLLPQPRERGRVNRAKPAKVLCLSPSQETQTPHEAALAGMTEPVALPLLTWSLTHE